MSAKTQRIDQLRELAEKDLYTFIKLVHPQRVLGHIHKDVCSWMIREDAKTHQLILLPRDHQKSALAAYRVAWEITRNPAIRVLYISATANLAQKQLKFIKDILTSDLYRIFWPDMVNREESKREKWTETEISVDHPLRKLEIVRDPTVFTAGLTTNIVGMHCDLAVLDDVVTDENAYTEEGRTKVANQASYLASIAGTEGRQLVVGTRYHPKDLYDSFKNMIYETFDEFGNVITSEELYEDFEAQVETRGDGTGEYLWPRQQREDGKWFGFNQEILARKKAQYSDKTKFRAQYYNNPNDAENAPISRNYFQYYDTTHLSSEKGVWYFKGKRLNIFAAVDFAYSKRKTADYTCIVVVGVDPFNNYFILDIDRFRTDKIKDYFDRILRLYNKWNFRKLRAEVTAAQKIIVQDLKENYFRPNGINLSIDEHAPTRNEGTKEERIEATLHPKYSNLQMWHYRGGNCESLEEELVMSKPPHDDIKDALSSCVEICVAPSLTQQNMKNKSIPLSVSYAHPRFGGIS